MSVKVEQLLKDVTKGNPAVGNRLYYCYLLSGRNSRAKETFFELLEKLPTTVSAEIQSAVKEESA